MASEQTNSSEDPGRREAFSALKSSLTGRPAGQQLRVSNITPTSIAALDRALGGGLPGSGLIALEGRSGRWSILAKTLANVTRRALAAIIDDGSLYPPGLVRAGVRLDRVMVVQASTPKGIARAADILIRSRACRLVLMGAPELRAAAWMRLAAVAHRAGVLLVAISERAGAALAAAASMRMRCELERVVLHGSRGPWCTVEGYDVRASIGKDKRAASGAWARVRAIDTAMGTELRERLLASDRPIHRERVGRAAVR
ncbi:MAG TPA: hypothetical protein VN936_10365 [Candidatus Acidoferrum sp.]|nr:hypothetical protein [Candidatus Acidoferrum sp.]